MTKVHPTCPLLNLLLHTPTKSMWWKNPFERKAIALGKTCLTCFGPKEKCNERGSETCNNVKAAKGIVCGDCVNVRKEKDIKTSAFNVFFCGKREHAKVSKEESLQLLKTYAPKIDDAKFTKNVVMNIKAVHAMASTEQYRSKTSAPTPDQPEVVFNPSSGERSLLDDDQPIKNTSAAPCTYILQQLQIGGSKCLCFFDTGANINMIDGAMAEKEKVTVLSQAVTKIKGVAGFEVVTDYGKYKLNLGPDTQGLLHGLKCYGMSDVAGPFDRHDLSEINDELRGDPRYSELGGNTPLPEYVGGSMVNLLLGISTQAQPVYLFTLESGISVYKSPFTDVFNSNLCYAGSHDSFIESSQLVMYPNACKSLCFLLDFQLNWNQI